VVPSRAAAREMFHPVSLKAVRNWSTVGPSSAAVFAAGETLWSAAGCMDRCRSPAHPVAPDAPPLLTVPRPAYHPAIVRHKR